MAQFLFYSKLHRAAMNTLRFIISNGTVWHSISAQIFYFFIHNHSKKSVSSQKPTENTVIMRLFVSFVVEKLFPIFFSEVCWEWLVFSLFPFAIWTAFNLTAIKSNGNCNLI